MSPNVPPDAHIETGEINGVNLPVLVLNVEQSGAHQNNPQLLLLYCLRRVFAEMKKGEGMKEEDAATVTHFLVEQGKIPADQADQYSSAARDIFWQFTLAEEGPYQSIGDNIEEVIVDGVVHRREIKETNKRIRNVKNEHRQKLDEAVGEKRIPAEVAESIREIIAVGFSDTKSVIGATSVFSDPNTFLKVVFLPRLDAALSATPPDLVLFKKEFPKSMRKLIKYHRAELLVRAGVAKDQQRGAAWTEDEVIDKLIECNGQLERHSDQEIAEIVERTAGASAEIREIRLEGLEHLRPTILALRSAKDLTPGHPDYIEFEEEMVEFAIEALCESLKKAGLLSGGNLQAGLDVISGSLKQLEEAGVLVIAEGRRDAVMQKVLEIIVDAAGDREKKKKVDLKGVIANVKVRRAQYGVNNTPEPGRRVLELTCTLQFLDDLVIAFQSQRIPKDSQVAMRAVNRLLGEELLFIPLDDIPEFIRELKVRFPD